MTTATATRTQQPATGHRIVAFGSNSDTQQQVAAWLARHAVDARLVRGVWEHRPLIAPPDGRKR